MLQIIQAAFYGDSISIRQLGELLYFDANGCTYVRIVSHPSPRKGAEAENSFKDIFAIILKAVLNTRVGVGSRAFPLYY